MRNRTQIAYSALYGGKFVLLGVQLPFMSGWLALRGFSPQEIGLVTGVALGLRLVLGPPVAFWADGQADERRPLRIIAFLFAAGGVLLAASPVKSAVVAGAILLIWSFGLLVPLTDSSVLSADRAGLLQYGKIRAVGSFAFLVSTVLGGEALTRFGLGSAGALMAGAGVATFLATLALPAVQAPKAGAGPRWRDAPMLLGEPRFLAALFAAGLTQAAHAVYYAFSILHWASLGYTPRVVGLLWATGVLAEIALLTRARGLARRLRPDLLIALGAAGAVARWLLTAAEPALPLLFGVQTLHALTFGATYIGTIEFVDRAIPRRLVNTAMTLHSTTGVGALTGLSTVVAGYIFAGHGASAAYVAMAGVAGTGFALALALSRMWRGVKLFD